MLISSTTFNSSLNVSCFAIVVKINVICSLTLVYSVLIGWLWQADNGDVKNINNLALNCCWTHIVL